MMETEDQMTQLPRSPAATASSGGVHDSIADRSPLMDPKVEMSPSALEPQYEEELLLKWDDHHKSFFELAEDLCHQELFIDVTLSCGEHNFPAHKLVLSVCSPYFRHLFLRNPCKHPIVVLKDVHFKYMKLLLMYMYRGEVSCPQEDLHGLLRTARSLQIRGLVELERKREAEGYLANSITGSPIKQLPPSHIQGGGGGTSDGYDGASTTSCDLDDFSIDEVRSRLHGQLDIQPISSQLNTTGSTLSHSNLPASWFSRTEQVEVLTPPPLPASSTTTVAASSSSTTLHHNTKVAVATSSNDSESHHSEDEQRHLHSHHAGQQLVPNLHPHQRLKQHLQGSNGHHSHDHHDHNRWADNNGRGSPATAASSLQSLAPPSASTKRSRTSSSMASSSSSSAAASSAALLAAAQAAGMPISALDPSDPMSSMNALLAAAQAHGNSSPSSTLASYLPSTTAAAASSKPANSSGRPASSGSANSNNNQQGVDLSQAAAMANLQLYYYMQKVAAAGMGNPKERKECPICGKTLYDRSTWNRHMRIHTGEKPYPCRFCGRRFRTNYNKLGHEKKCPDRHAFAMMTSNSGITGGNGGSSVGPHQGAATPSPGPNISNSPKESGATSTVGASEFN